MVTVIKLANVEFADVDPGILLFVLNDDDDEDDDDTIAFCFK